MNLVDVLVLLALGLAVYEGWRAGFLATTFGLITWIVGLGVAIAAHAPAAGAVAALTGIAVPAARAIAFVVILFVAEALFAVLSRFALGPLVALVRLHHATRLVDHVAGITPSVARTLVIVAITLAALVAFPIAPEVRHAIDQSRLGSALVAEVAALQPRLERLLGAERGGELLLITRLSADERQQLQLPDDLALAPDPEAERQLFELVNQERVARGLRPLQVDPRLVPVARAHAEEMFRLKYFGHVSPVTGTPFDRLALVQIRYQRAGENLAYAQSVAVAHRGLMESPGHRENILRPEFTRLGVGVVSAGLYGRMYVQLFLTP